MVCLEEARQKGEHMDGVNEMLFNLFSNGWGNVIKPPKSLPNKLLFKKWKGRLELTEVVNQSPGHLEMRTRLAQPATVMEARKAAAQEGNVFCIWRLELRLVWALSPSSFYFLSLLSPLYLPSLFSFFPSTLFPPSFLTPPPSLLLSLIWSSCTYN